jgi:hypothetical protein
LTLILIPHSQLSYILTFNLAKNLRGKQNKTKTTLSVLSPFNSLILHEIKFQNRTLCNINAPQYFLNKSCMLYYLTSLYCLRKIWILWISLWWCWRWKWLVSNMLRGFFFLEKTNDGKCSFNIWECLSTYGNMPATTGFILHVKKAPMTYLNFRNFHIYHLLE